MAKKQFEDGTDLIEIIWAIVREALGTDERRSRIELVRFSGKEDDVIRSPDEKIVYLRCQSERRRDGEGNATPFVCRLASVGGFWWIPDAECELVAFIPEEVGGASFAGYVLPISVTPPKKLASGVKAFWKLGTAAKLLVEAGGIIFKAGAGTTFGIDKDTGAFSVTMSNGTHLQLLPGSLQIAICDGATPNNVLAALRLSADGVELVSSKPSAGKKQIWKLDAATGDAVLVGTGTFYGVYSRGALGKTPTGTIDYASAGATSTSWYVSP